MSNSRRTQGVLGLLAVLAIGLVSVLLFQTNKIAQAQTSSSQTCPVATGKPYRTLNHATVYLVTPECTKRPFFNPSVYLSFFADWKQVTVVRQSVLDSIPNDSLNFLPWGPRRNFRTGSLIKVTSDPTVYLVVGNKAYPLEDEAAFASLGFTFNQVEDVTEATLAKYQIQSEHIRTVEDVPAFTVFKYSNDAKVYVLRQEDDQVVKEHVTSTEALNALARADRIVTLPSDCSFANAEQQAPDEAAPSSAQATSSDTVAPSITSFKLPSLTSSRDVRITELTATDNVGVTKYLVRTSSVKPGVNAYAWISTPPTHFVFASSGVKTLYAWVKDAAGNISAPATSTVTIDTVKPVVTFTIPSSSTSLTVTITQFAATDAYGIGGYALTESSSAPSASSSAWSVTAPMSYTFATSGTKTLYAWAKDAAGNISSGKRATVKIVGVSSADTVAPTVNVFTLPSTSTSRTVMVTSFTATDNIGVTGYLVTESATAPALNAAGWSSSPQTAYVFTTDGTKTLYAWAKDAAGNISNGKSASVAVSSSQPGDTTAPVISSIASSTAAMTATVTWTTNEPSTSVVEYGSTVSYGTVVTSTSLVTSHSVALSGLTSNMLYHFRVSSADAAGNVARTGDYTLKTSGQVSTSTLPVGWLYTSGNKIYLSDGNGGGTPWMGRGVNVDDLFLCGYNSGLWMESSAEQAFTSMVSGLMSSWKPNFVRVSLGMNSYDQVSWTSNPSQYKTPMTNIINSIGSYPNTYVLVTLRSDASMGPGVDEATNYPITATDATYKALVNTFANSKFVMFGLSNEPGGNTLSNSAISSAMNHAVSVIRAEEDRLGVPHHVIAVQGNSWTSEIGFYSTASLQYDNIVYEVHGYPPDTASYTYNNLPVILGEYGTLTSSSAPSFFADLEAKQISSLAWDFEPYSNCAPDLLSVNYSSTNLVPTTWGKLVQNYLLSHAQ